MVPELRTPEGGSPSNRGPRWRCGRLVMLGVVILIFGGVPRAAGQTQAADCAVFETIYTNSRMTIPWTRGACCGYMSLRGASVTCTNNRVVTASFSGQTLLGAIPPLAGLTQLTSLDLSSNLFSGTIPALTALTQLRTLRLNTNALTGAIPNLSKLAALREVQLSGNMLAGNIDGLLPTGLTTCGLVAAGSNPGLYTCTKDFPAACSTLAAIDVGTTCPRSTTAARTTQASTTVASSSAIPTTTRPTTTRIPSSSSSSVIKTTASSSRTTTTTSSSVTSSSPSTALLTNGVDGTDQGSNAGVIAGATLGMFAFVGLAGGGAFLMIRRNQSKRFSEW
ncbi:hypothetical protein M427DRAFT_217177 [Gonapodya prolifera JEL478]|uniref:L domain-like protein n=1 Tax=Gonapodya prolifera (strain JEL478) TaxID=1344416 RepID=A0A138ZYS9_GONPJ|nr:hypothetical protein M427DRAFT_217177 [Gonapodya prolifera JEL478]|eukprot:KXS09659.1 hypothetical protein M427DRAFT_217177 [Gonapodya prolifera JEL478]